MRQALKNKAVLVVLFWIFVYSPSYSATEKNVSILPRIIPRPLDIKMGKGHFQLDETIHIVMDDQSVEAGFVREYLQSWLKNHVGLAIGFQNTPAVPSIVFSNQGMDESLGTEGYILEIKPKGIFIEANAAAGWFYAVQTLIQLFPAGMGDGHDSADVHFNLPVIKIIDKPRFLWRGMHLDVCRHFFPVDFVKRYIDLIAMHKMNIFHWHLTEDQGWRIEIKKYPRLTEIGAWRVDREDRPWNEREPQQPGEAATYGGFYTQQEVKEIVDYAQSRFVTIVPEIEMPAHAVAALAAYPEYSCSGGPFTVMPGGYWPNTIIFCAGNDATFDFLEGILTEVTELFPGPYIHIGGDEADKTEWKKCLKCQARIQTENLRNEKELQSYFVRRIEKILISRNKRLIGWDEILDGGLAPEATVMSWRGIKGGIEAANQEHDVVMTPTAYCYFDYYQADSDEPPAIGGFVPLEKVYSFEPVPDNLPVEKHRCILGAQGNLWTEYIPNGSHAEYMAVPRMCALAEVVWSDREGKNWDDFLSRLSVHYLRLDAMHVNYRVPAVGGFYTENIFLDSTLVSLTKPRPDLDLFYTFDGTLPNRESLHFAEPLKITENCTLTVQAFAGDQAKGRVKQGIFKKQPPMKAIKVNQPLPGLNFTYSEGIFTSVKDLQSAPIQYTGSVEEMQLPGDLADDHFGITFSGFFRAPMTGVYTFYLTSDDGSQLLLHDVDLILNDGFHSATTLMAQIALEQGLHPLTVRFFEGYGNEFLQVDFSGPCFLKGTLPRQLLFRK